VLLLNTALTVRAKEAGSHQGKGWEVFTDKVVEVVDRYGGANLGDRAGFGRGVVFMAWGAWAQKRVVKLDKVCGAPLHVPLSNMHCGSLAHALLLRLQKKHLVLQSAVCLVATHTKQAAS
jgi:uracil DNA glycosylase